MREADDYLAEVHALSALLDGRADALDLVTQFKGWTIADVIGHLHMFDVAARLSLEDALGRSDGAFPTFFAPVGEAMANGRGMMGAQMDWLAEQDLNGNALVDRWGAEAERLAALFRETDPKARVAWAGPSMSARSSVTARQMEVWAHGHEVFDRLGVVRKDADRIRNIAHMGVATFGWTFQNRGEDAGDRPTVRLTAPSGALWEWEGSDERVEGSATGFCETVTQTRNVADTDVRTTGETAARWMDVAQCFAGPAVDPPKPGERCIQLN